MADELVILDTDGKIAYKFKGDKLYRIVDGKEVLVGEARDNGKDENNDKKVSKP